MTVAVTPAAVRGATPAGVEPANRSASWVSVYCSVAFFFFQGALTHVFGSDDGGGDGPLKVFFLPIAIFIQLLAVVLLTRRHRLRKAVELLGRNRTMLVALAVIVMSALWSIDPAISLRRAAALLGTTAVGLLIYIEIGRARILRFFAVHLAAFTVLSVMLAVAVPNLGTHVNDQFAGLWRGLLTFKNQAAWSAALFILCWLAVRKVGWMKTWNYPLLAIGVLMLVRAGSATGLVAVAFGVACMILLNLYKRFSLMRPLMLASALVLIAAALTDVEGLFASTLEMLGRDASLTGRTSIWLALWPLIESKPWLGSGYLAFWDHAASYFGGSSWMAEVGHAHNAYIEILLDLGIVGLVTQVLFLVAVMWRLFRLAVRGDGDASIMFVVFLTLTIVGIAGALFFRANTGVWVMIVAFVCYAADRPPTVAASRQVAING